MINRNGFILKEYKLRGNNFSLSKLFQLFWEDLFVNLVDKSKLKFNRCLRIIYIEDGFFEKVLFQVVKIVDVGKKNKNKYKNCLVQ